MYQADNDLRRYFDNNKGRLLHKWLHYFEIYDHHFNRYRDKPVIILEIGVFHGGSIKLWRDYFGPLAKIYGVDIDPRCKQFEEENVHIFIGDQGDPAFLRRLREEIPRPDILIDDGGHLMHQQIATFQELYPSVADDGIYLCEDLHTSYWPEWGGGVRRPGTFMEFAKQLVDTLHGYYSKDTARFSPTSITRSAHSLHFYDSMLVIEKQRRDMLPRDGRSGSPVFEEGSIGSFPTPNFTFAVLTHDPQGGQIEERVFRPNALVPSRFKLVYGGWVENNQFKYVDELIHGADGYLIHGLFPAPLSADVLDHIFSSGKPVIYFFDESMPELASEESRARSGFRQHLRESLKLSHLLVVESENQRDIYKALNPNIVILPQKLDAKAHLPITPAGDGAFQIIYRGSEGHLNNLLPIKDALRKVADQYPGKFEFHFFGRGLAALGEHPAFHFNPMITHRQEWDEAIQRIQPALALLPLQNTPAHALSSSLPLLEYAAYGIPVLASDVVPYQYQVRQRETGLLLANDSDAWFNALEDCLKYSEIPLHMGRQARHWFENHHALTGSENSLHKAFEQAIQNGTAARSRKPQVDFMALNKQDEYYKWLLTQQIKPHEAHWMEEEYGRWSDLPRFHLLITLLPVQAKWLKHTLDSLETQIYPHWKVTIVAFTPQPDNLDLDDRVCWHELGDDEDSYEALNRLAQEQGFDWIGFVEAGDRLAPQAFFKAAFHSRLKPEWKIIYTDEDQISVEAVRSRPLFKPDYNHDLLHSYPYFGGLCLFDGSLYAQLGGIDGSMDGVEDYDLLLRCTEHIAPGAIGHLAEILYTRFARGGHCIRSRQDIWESSMQSLRNHFERRASEAQISTGPYVGTHEVIYPLTRTPLVSILIPTRDHLELIKPCIDSLLDKTDYPEYEVLILNNDSRDAEVIDYFGAIRLHPNIRILDYPHSFNFSAICNFGAREAKGEYLLLLNNDTEITHPSWLSEMMRHGLRPNIGIVGARLLFPNGTLQHAGVVIGMQGVAEHPFISASPDDPGYMMRAGLVQNYSAVTAACLLIRKEVYDEAGGMDETDLKVLYNDVDLCLKVREYGREVVWTPASSLIHKASVSIKKQLNSSQRYAQMRRAEHERDTMYERWLEWMAYDPAYNRNLTQESRYFELEKDPALGWDPDWRPAPRILAYPGDLQGCGEYRLVAPCRALNAAGMAQAHVCVKLLYPGQFAKIDPDVVILQRQVGNEHLDAINEIRRFGRAFRVFEIDDLLHNLPPRSTHRDSMHGDELERLSEGISMCDRLVTTSTALANAYGKFCGEVKIVPNFLERAKWGQLQPLRLQGRKPRVGWAGGMSHTGDLELLHPVIEALHKEVDWVFFGMCPESLRPYIREYHESTSLDYYPSKLASLNLDLALAPLEYHPFNDAKSALKVLEYGALGYPVICTDIVTYQGDFPVMRVSNNPKEWIDAVHHSIVDRDALAAQGNALRLHILENWMLEDNLDKWLKGWLP